MHRHSILVVGAGSIGERHIRCFVETGRADVVFTESRPDRLEEVARRYPTATAVRSLEEALSLEPEAAVIATPAPSHIPLGLEAARRGLHLLIEKPLALDLEAIPELADTVDRMGLIAGVAYVYRARPGLQKLRTSIRSGQHGRPLQLVLTTGQCFPHYRPQYRDIYYNDRATGGGAIQDALTHMINAGEYLLGPLQVRGADADHQALEGVPVEDTVHVIGRHGATLACYTLNQYQAPNELTLTLVFERATARLETHRSTLSWMERPGGDWRIEELEPSGPDAPFLRQAHSFLDTLEGKGPLLCSLEEGLQTLHATLDILSLAGEPGGTAGAAHLVQPHTS